MVELSHGWYMFAFPVYRDMPRESPHASLFPADFIFSRGSRRGAELRTHLLHRFFRNFSLLVLL